MLRDPSRLSFHRLVYELVLNQSSLRPLTATATTFKEFLDNTNTTKVIQLPFYSATPGLPERPNKQVYFVPLRNYLRCEFDAMTKGMVFQQRFEAYAPDGSGALAPAEEEFFAPQLLLADALLNDTGYS